MRGVRPSGVLAVAERADWKTDAECRKARDRAILAMSRDGKTSRQIAIVLNIHPASVRRIRAKIARRNRERINGKASRLVG